MTQRRKKRWENQELTAIGRREARTSFYEDSFSRISMNGKWQFLYLDAPELSPAERLLWEYLLAHFAAGL